VHCAIPRSQRDFVVARFIRSLLLIPISWWPLAVLPADRAPEESALAVIGGGVLIERAI
jgi:hypothetical protein